MQGQDYIRLLIKKTESNKRLKPMIELPVWQIKALSKPVMISQDYGLLSSNK